MPLEIILDKGQDYFDYSKRDGVKYFSQVDGKKISDLVKE